MLCRCLVDSNPKPAVTWSINGTVPPQHYNMSVASSPDMLTATLSGHMDKQQMVICFAFNALGNDSLTLLQGEEGVFRAHIPGNSCTFTVMQVWCGNISPAFLQLITEREEK